MTLSQTHRQVRTAPKPFGPAPRRTAPAAACGLLAPPALATPAPAAPVHLPLPSLNITGLEKACGAAVDSEGDVYLASAGGSEVKVFDSTHTELASIPNANEPCGLAADSKGNLYVSEQATG